MTNLKKQLATIATKLTIFVISIVSVCFLANGVIMVIRAQHAATENAQHNADNTLNAAIDALDLRIKAVETATQRFAQSNLINSTDTLSGYRLLEKLLNACPYISASTLLFRENYYPQIGREYAPTIMRSFLGSEERVNNCQFGLTYLSPGNEDYNWEQSHKGQKVWSAPYLAHANSLRSFRVAYSVPCFDNSNNFIGVLCSTIETEWVGVELEQVINDDDVVVRVIYQNGAYLYHTDSTLVTRDAVAIAANDSTELHLIAQMMAGERGSMQTGVNGEYTTFFAPLQRSNWAIAISYPTEALLANTREMSRQMTWAGIGILMLLIIVIPVGVFVIVKPYYQRFKIYTEERASLERDLQIASDLQKGMLPSTEKELSGSEPFQISCMLHPAKLVGGDFYDFKIIGGKLYFTIGDVSGKGVPASLFMTALCIIFRDIINYEDSPEKIVARINNTIVSNNNECIFCTMFVAIYDPATGVLEYCNAGHNPPIVIQHNADDTDNIHYLSQGDNLPTGVIDDAEYEKSSILMRNNDAILLYTDGITEAKNADEEMFGEQRTIENIINHHNGTANNVTQALLNEVVRFSNGVEQSDDITMLYVKITNTQRS